MDWELLGCALALVLVIEGLFPFMSPQGWKRTFARLLELQDGQLRFFGLCSMLLGLLLFWMASG
ncbi:MAG TPA: DUF2065 domain-containing protein [Ramlibacter sp.]|nr:DUF2065 domain-containing protein [Ramlibacter sp.]